MSKLATLSSLNYRNKKVFLRVDYNVVEGGKIIDKFRIEQSLPTLLQLLNNGCSVILASHNGRPDGRVDDKLSLRPVAQVLANLINKKVVFLDDCIGSEVARETSLMKPGEVILLENLRFHAAEEKNNASFAKALASLADVYVDDAFANAHRSHASMVGVPKYLPHAAGVLMQNEYETIEHIISIPDRPYLAVIGGAKISTKIEVLESLVAKVNTLFIGGAMLNTFLQALGYNVGKSITEPDCIGVAKKIIQMAESKGIDLIIPKDVVVAKSAKHGAKYHTVGVGKIQKDDIVLDIGDRKSVV